MADGEYLLIQDAVGRTPPKGPPTKKRNGNDILRAMNVNGSSAMPREVILRARTVTDEDRRAQEKKIAKRRAKKKR